jgi:hypothetical protein
MNSLAGNPSPRRSSFPVVARAVAGRVLRGVRPKRKPRPMTEFLLLKETLKLANEAGVSVGDYLERRRMSGGQTPLELTIEGLDALQLFQPSNRTVR